MSTIVKKIKGTLSNKSVKASVWYTVGNYFLKGVGFITLPIFARLMTTKDYGHYNTFLAYEGIIYLFINLGLHVSLKNARNDFGDDKVDEYTSSISILPIIALAVILALANIFSGVTESLLKLDRFQFNLLLIYCYGAGMLTIYNARIALDYRFKDFLGLSYFNTFSNIIISILLMLFVFTEQRYLARIIGTVASMTFVFSYIIFSLWKKAKPTINSIYWKYGLKLSLPIIPHGIGQVVLLSFDRIMITRYIGASETGIYGFAYTVFSIIQITAGSLSTVFEPWAFKRLAENEQKTVIRRGTQFYFLLISIASAAILVGPEIIKFLGSEKYSDSIYCMIPIVIGGTFAMTYNIPSLLSYYHKKTNYIAISTIFVALLNILLNYIFILRYGYVAAAYTTLACYLIYFIIHYILSIRIGGFKIIPIYCLFIGFGAVTIIGAFTLATLSAPLLRYVSFIIIIGIVGFWGVKKYKSGELNFR